MKNSAKRPQLAYSPVSLVDDNYNPNKTTRTFAKLFSFNRTFSTDANNNITKFATLSTDDKIHQNSCLLEHSPFYIHKVSLFRNWLIFQCLNNAPFQIAQTDRLNEFKLALASNKSGLHLRDKVKGWCPIHYAVSKDSTLILEFILDNSEGKYTR